MTTATPTLTSQEYLSRCAELDAALAQKTEAYEIAALHAVHDDASRPQLAQMRQELAALEQERADLDAAWRGAERQRREGEDTEDARQRRAALATAEERLDDVLQLAAEAEQAVQRLGDCFERLARTRDSLARGVLRLADEQSRAQFTARVLISATDLDLLLEPLPRRFKGEPAKEPAITETVRRRIVYLRRLLPTILRVPPEQVTAATSDAPTPPIGEVGHVATCTVPRPEGAPFLPEPEESRVAQSPRSSDPSKETHV